MRKKRLAALLLSILMLIALVPTAVTADEVKSNLKISLSATEIIKGDTLTVTISHKAMKVISFTGGVTFDPALLECTQIKTAAGYQALAQTAVSPQLSTVQEANSCGKIGVGFPHTAEGSFAAADLLVITFRAKATGTVSLALYEDSDGTNGYRGAGTSVEALLVLDHDYGAWTKLNDTQHQRVCKNDASHIEKEAHTWDDGVVTTPATTSATGTMTYTCSVCHGTKTETIAKLKTLSTPVLSSVTNAATGVTVKWAAVSGAAQYRVFYKTADGSWKKFGDTTGTSLTVTGLTSNTKYSFTVRCLSADGKSFTSSYDNTGKSITYVAAPAISSVSNAAKGVTVKWAAVKGAGQYRVFYKTADGSWKKAADTTSTSYTVSGLTSGTEYSFTVRCLSKDGKSFTSSYDSTGKSITYVAAPVISSVSNSANGVTVKWAAVEGAAQYRVYYKTTDGSWTKFGDTTDTSLTVTGLTSNTKYSFTVRCLSADGKSFTSSYDNTGKSITYVAAPAISSVSNSANGVTVKWAAVEGAAQYRVYYKTTDGSWKKFGDTTDTSLTVTGLTSNTKYSFTVRCLSADGKSFTSSYDNTGKGITYVAAPVISSVSNAAKGVTVKWAAVSGAAQYRVYYKTTDGSWKKFGDTTGTSLTVTGLTSNTKYSFTVRCLSADGKSFTSSYDNTGKSITYVAAPVISSVANAANGVTVKWAAVSGAAQYRVFYKTADASWKKAADTTSTSYTVTGLTSGTEYSFTVRCLSKDGKSFTSGYDSVGKSITYAP